MDDLSSSVVRFTEQKVAPRGTLIAVVPTDESSFKAVFGYSPTTSQLGTTRKAQSALQSLGKGHVYHDSVKPAGGLLATIRKSEDQFLIIVGHNEGGLFRLPWEEDGTRFVALDEIATTCTQAGKRCIIISCEAADYIPPDAPHYASARALDLVDAVRLVESTFDLFKSLSLSKSETSLRAVALHVSETDAKIVARRESTATLMWVIGAGAIGAVAVYESTEAGAPPE